MKKIQKIVVLCASLGIVPTGAFSQTMYKCPDPAGTVRFQQVPCSPTGGGESVTVKSIPTGAGSGLSDDAKSYIKERDEQRKQSAQSQARPAATAMPEECFSMRRRIRTLEEREARGIHTRVNGEEESVSRKREYEDLCGAW
ncbi:MAG: DUF4124 domain-containing protein [Phycisphaerales bacterium]|nr:DUF4124 domain-containing protein [Phycisphaerales bacterium]